jgi:hypothetical protein
MAYKNRFHKTTLGYDAQVIVSKGVEYTDDATFALFVANAAEGEVGIFKTSDDSAYDGLAAAAAGTEVYIALKRDSGIEKSLPFVIGTAVITKNTYVAPVKHVITVATTAPTALVKGDYVEVSIIETTPGMQPLPTYNYGLTAKASETWTQLMTRLVALINDSTAIENKDRTQLVDAAITATDDFTLTAKRNNEHFTVALRGVLADQASFSVTTQFKFGTGTVEQAQLAEAAGDIRSGVTTNYPDQNASAAEFGKPTSFVSAADQFEVVTIKFQTKDYARTLEQDYTRKNYISFYVNSNGAANPSAEVNTILGI